MGQMLKQEGTGKLFPYTPILASRPDMSLVDEPIVVSKKEFKFKTLPTEKPGPGWVKNVHGSWTRRK